jgi:hypothetical protein
LWAGGSGLLFLIAAGLVFERRDLIG